jgi:hypothetical protein
VAVDPEDIAGADPGPVAVEIPGKTAVRLAKVAQEVGARAPGEVVAQAIGLLQLLLQAKARGQRVIVRDPRTGHEVDLAV